MALPVSLPKNWEKQEEIWFYKEYYPHRLQVLNKSERFGEYFWASRFGPGVTYLRYCREHGKDVRKVNYAASLALAGEDWKAWNLAYHVSKKRCFDYANWEDVAHALEKRSTTVESKRAQKLLDNFQVGIESVSAEAKDTAWKVSECYAKAVLAGMKPSSSFLCFTFGGSRR